MKDKYFLKLNFQKSIFYTFSIFPFHLHEVLQDFWHDIKAIAAPTKKTY
jgi:hypothetical protein